MTMTGNSWIMRVFEHSFHFSREACIGSNKIKQSIVVTNIIRIKWLVDQSHHYLNALVMDRNQIDSVFIEGTTIGNYANEFLLVLNKIQLTFVINSHVK